MYTKVDSRLRSNEDASSTSNRSFPFSAFTFLLMLLVTPLLPVRGTRIKFKGYSGIRKFPESTREAYFADQTIAVVELGQNRDLLNCELIEVFKPKEALDVKETLAKSVSKPAPISFQHMFNLMDQCQQLESNLVEKESRSMTSPSMTPSLNLLAFISQRQYIFPGTKWCGSGDVAKTYYDLGSDKNFDLCCRTHDLCPVKLQPYTTRYNITNKSFYSKSHCVCDDRLYDCLKKLKHPLADFMGNFYFNFMRIQCIEDVEPNKCIGDECLYSELRELVPRRFRQAKKY